MWPSSVWKVFSRTPDACPEVHSFVSSPAAQFFASVYFSCCPPIEVFFSPSFTLLVRLFWVPPLKELPSEDHSYVAHTPPADVLLVFRLRFLDPYGDLEVERRRPSTRPSLSVMHQGCPGTWCLADLEPTPHPTVVPSVCTFPEFPRFRTIFSFRKTPYFFLFIRCWREIPGSPTFC